MLLLYMHIPIGTTCICPASTYIHVYIIKYLSNYINSKMLNLVNARKVL